MKSFIVLALLVAVAVAAPANPDADAQIVKFTSDNIGLDGYGFELETTNGIKQSETGALKNVGTDDEAFEVRGQYSYPGTDGLQYLVIYIANEKGFQPQGTHLPTAA